MAKLVTNDLVSLANQTTAIANINGNMTLIETAMEKTLSRDGTSPNAMEANLDMNSNRLINLPPPTTDHEPVRIGDLEALTGGTVNINVTATDTDQINHQQPGTGGTVRTVEDILNDNYVNVKNFGVLGDGTTNDYANIVLGDAFASGSGKALYFPAGTYNIAGNTLVPVQGAHWIGENRFDTIIRTTSATADVFDLTTGFITIEGIQVASSVVRSGGYYFDIASGNVTVKDFYLSAPFEGIRFNTGSSVVRIQNGEIANTVATTGISIRVVAALASSVENVVGSGSTAPFAHVYVQSCGDLSFDEDCHFIGAARNMVFAPGDGETCVSVDFRGYLDQATNFNLAFAQTGTGTIRRCTFSGAWLSSGVNANVNFSGTTGTVNGITFLDCEMYDASYGLSIDATAGVVSNIQVIGGRIADAAVAGVNANNMTGGLQIVGAKIGSTGGFGVNVTGIVLSGTTDDVMITGCDVEDNTTPLTNTASGTSIILFNNKGISTNIINGTITPLTSDGAALGSTTRMFSDLFLASGGVVNFNNGNYTLTHSAGVLTANGAFAATAGTFTDILTASKSFTPAGAGTTRAINTASTRATAGTGGDTFVGIDHAMIDNGSTDPVSMAGFRMISTYNNAANTSAFNNNFDSSIQIAANVAQASGFVSNCTVFSGTLTTYNAIKVTATSGTITNKRALLVESGGGDVLIQQTTASTSSTTGAIVLSGGMGLAGALHSAASIRAHSGTAVPAGGTAGAGLLVSSTTNLGVFFGSGAPSLSAAQGSLYIRTDGSSTSTRLYVNTNGTTGWTNVTTAA